MSSGPRSRARAKSSGRSRRVTSRASHARSARARACAALYQWRLFALTLPTTTLFSQHDRRRHVGVGSAARARRRCRRP